MKMTELQFEMIKENLRQLTSKDCFYKEKLKAMGVDTVFLPHTDGISSTQLVEILQVTRKKND